MARVNVFFKGRGNTSNFIKRQVATIKDLSERHIREVAEETVTVIRRKISERLEREDSTGNLANSMFSVKILDGYGVGDIDFLNKSTKYWYWQNYGVAQSGRKTPPPTKGAFKSGNPAPSSSGGSSRWSHSSTGPYMLIPKKAITPKNYIEATIAEINNIILSVVKRKRL